MANTTNLELVKPIGTDHALVSDLNGNSDKIDAYAGKVNTGLDGLRDGIAILADGNTHGAITSGQFVYVKNHQTLPEGLYKASANIAANATLSTSNLTADAKGGLNSLNEMLNSNITNLIQTLDVTINTPTFSRSSAGVYYYDKNFTVPTGYKAIAISVTSWSSMSGIIYATLYGQTTIELLANSNVSVSAINVRIVLLKQ